MKYTKHFLKKTEDLFSELAYIIRYERGSFQSGYCMVEDRQIAVINKFFDTEARINTLIEIISIIEVDQSKLSESGLALYKTLLKEKAKSENASIGTEEEETAESTEDENANAESEETPDKPEETPEETPEDKTGEVTAKAETEEIIAETPEETS